MKLIKKVAIIGIATFVLGSTVAFADGPSGTPAPAAPAATSGGVASNPDCAKTGNASLTANVPKHDGLPGADKKDADAASGKTQ
jgi:hypothetical protein